MIIRRNWFIAISPVHPQTAGKSFFLADFRFRLIAFVRVSFTLILISNREKRAALLELLPVQK